jgi:hypothetical protein
MTKTDGMTKRVILRMAAAELDEIRSVCAARRITFSEYARASLRRQLAIIRRDTSIGLPEELGHCAPKVERVTATPRRDLQPWEPSTRPSRSRDPF